MFLVDWLFGLVPVAVTAFWTAVGAAFGAAWVGQLVGELSASFGSFWQSLGGG